MGPGHLRRQRRCGTGRPAASGSARQQEFDAGAYEQAARVFRQHGYQREAEDILIAQRLDAASAAARRPGTSRLGVAPCGNGQVRCFNPVFYAVDTVVPLVSLGQRTAWYPNRAAPWGAFVDTWLNLATLLGWVLSSIFLLSFTRSARAARPTRRSRATGVGPPIDAIRLLDRRRVRP